MRNHFVRWSVLLAIGLLIGTGIVYVRKQDDLDSGVTEIDGAATILKKPVSSPVAGAPSDIGGAFALMDQNGQNVTQDTYKDSYKLIFFGFTYCPAVCPTELQKISKVMDGLGEISAKMQPLFISVDPERDTPTRLKEYMASFHSKLIGLTGTQAQIDAVKQSFRVYANKVENDMMEGYMFDHSAFTYLMSPENKLVAIYPSKDTAETIINDIKARGLQ